jgi:hypothetical protein
MDIVLFESGNGGDISIKNGDIEMTDSILQQPYIAHFGGNLEANTTGEEIEGEERFDWWGNMLIPNQDNQINSNLERTLTKVALNSSGFKTIQIAATNDLDFITDEANVTINLALNGLDKLKLSDILDQKQVDFIWDATKNELIEEIVI